MSKQVNPGILVKSQLGQELSPEEASTLAVNLTVKDLTNDEYLVKEGDKDDTLFVLAKGALAVITRIDDEDKTVYTMHEGECSGTRAFVDRTPRMVTLRSIGNSTIYGLKPSDFEAMLESHPAIVYKIMRAIFRITHSNLMRMNQETQQLTNYITKSGGRY